MFISVLDLFKIGIGPSSSHTVGPMVAALAFRKQLEQRNPHATLAGHHIRCTLKGSLAFTGKGHATDRAVILGLNGYAPDELTQLDVAKLSNTLWAAPSINIAGLDVSFCADTDLIFDFGAPLPEHPNGMIFELLDAQGQIELSETLFSIGGGFVTPLAKINQSVAPIAMESLKACPFAFDSAKLMLEMANDSGLSIAQMKRMNELKQTDDETLSHGMDRIWEAMEICIHKGLHTHGILPGVLAIERRASSLYKQLMEHDGTVDVSEWLCAYAMAVNEENAAGHAVVTAPTNGAAGVIPAVLYYFVQHEHGNHQSVRTFLLTAAAIGGLIKHRSSISGAEVGCQGEVGSAAAMAAAGLCAVRGGTPEQVENAAEMALEHHLGMTCDPVEGLVQVPCIERNGFGAIKAYTAASLSLRGSGQHFMPLDACISAMKETGREMSTKYKETSLGGLAVTVTEC